MKDKVDNDKPLSAFQDARACCILLLTQTTLICKTKACSKVFENVLHNYTNKTNTFFIVLELGQHL